MSDEVRFTPASGPEPWPGDAPQEQVEDFNRAYARMQERMMEEQMRYDPPPMTATALGLAVDRLRSASIPIESFEERVRRAVIRLDTLHEDFHDEVLREAWRVRAAGKVHDVQEGAEVPAQVAAVVAELAKGPSLPVRPPTLGEQRAQDEYEKRAAGWRGADSLPFDADYD